jgi:hypothetical protein
MSSSFQTWAATGVATIASTYLLDLVSAGAGALLVASGLLHGVGAGAASAFLAASYLVWAGALRPSLAANWDLLQKTGGSTCLPSKLAHDLALRRRTGERTRRIAAALGYVGAEIAKEAPYYLGAVGLMLFADGMGPDDALIFLGGANLGAAAYEYGLAWGTRRLLAHAPAAPYAAFETDWSPERYLADYYRGVEPDERLTLAFFVEAARAVPAGASVLVFGAGPTLHHAFPFASARVIDLSDVLPGNLAEIRRWIDAESGAHNWRPFVRHTLGCEGRAADPAAVARRETQTRDRIGRLLLCDLRDAVPLGASHCAYDVVVTAYCPDSATGDAATWALYMQRIASLVRPGGLLVVAALRRCHGYHVGGRTFPSADIDEADLRAVLAALAIDVHVEAHPLPEQALHGYRGILLARCRIMELSMGCS